MNDISLALFFTGGLGLRTWAETGNLERELAIYKKLRSEIKQIHLISYGGRSDIQYKSSLNGLNLHPVPWLGSSLFTRYLVRMRYERVLKEVDIFKTNQIFGADIALWMKEILNKKLIVRCGYLYSDFMRKGNCSQRKIAQAMALENRLFQKADAGVVTSEWQRDLIIKEYKLFPEKIHVIPNYVVTDVFTPVVNEKKYDLIFIGRYNIQKNVEGLIKALKILKKRDQNYSLLMVGGCNRNNVIRSMISEYNLNVSFQGNVPNFALPALLNSARAYILPSFYEGHPKTLLEAMSCGLPCIGTNVQGIREDIKHGETGYLCGTEPGNIAEAIHTVLTDDSLQNIIGKSARQYIVENYSLDKILPVELNLIAEVMGC